MDKYAKEASDGGIDDGITEEQRIGIIRQALMTEAGSRLLIEIILEFSEETEISAEDYIAEDYIREVFPLEFQGEFLRLLKKYRGEYKPDNVDPATSLKPFRTPMQEVRND